MARARNIKPGLYKNEDLAECSIWARFIFPGLWMLADRDGRLEDRPKRIKAELLAFDSQDAEPLLVELEARGFLVRYRNQDGSFIQISKFSTHQTPHYSEKKSVIKPPDSWGTPGNSVDDEGNNPRTPPEDSGNPLHIKGGSQPPDSLNPDSLNPDSLNPDSLNSGGVAAQQSTAAADPANPISTDAPLPETPTLISHYSNFFTRHGMDYAHTLSVKSRTLFRDWLARGVTFATLDDALKVAVQRAGGMPTSPLYLREIVNTLIAKPQNDEPEADRIARLEREIFGEESINATA